MKIPFKLELFIATRYILSKKRDQFISFISIASMLGISIGVATLIIVMSVMNGFQKELKEKILGVVSHLQVNGNNTGLNDWQGVIEEIKSQSIIAKAPYINVQALLTNSNNVQGVMVRGIITEYEKNVSNFSKSIIKGSLNSLNSKKFNIVIGIDLARILGVSVGEKIVLVSPQGQITPAGFLPRIKQFTVSGIFDIGMYEYDSSFALINLYNAQKIFKMSNEVSGIRIKISNLLEAPIVNKELSNLLNRDYYSIRDWTQIHSNFFDAIKIEKTVMFIILSLVIAVAAFNLISSLVIAVKEKKRDIAILRTMGISAQNISIVFIIQGSIIGVVGSVIGGLLGIAVAFNLNVIIPFLENLFQVNFLSKDIYYISQIPSEVLFYDIFYIVILAIFLSLISTIYPSFKAAKTDIIEVLKNE